MTVNNLFCLDTAPFELISHTVGIQLVCQVRRWQWPLTLWLCPRVHTPCDSGRLWGYWYYHDASVYLCGHQESTSSSLSENVWSRGWGATMEELGRSCLLEFLLHVCFCSKKRNCWTSRELSSTSQRLATPTIGSGLDKEAETLMRGQGTWATPCHLPGHIAVRSWSYECSSISDPDTPVWDADTPSRVLHTAPNACSRGYIYMRKVNAPLKFCLLWSNIA